MIDVKSLRIGNIIKDKNGNLREVAYITECVGLKNDIGGIDKYQKEPIISFDIETLDFAELSEELLLKCGAINKFGRTYFIGKIKFDINTLNIVRFHYSGKVAYIDYLHQLQNLWHSLYNEELQINL